MGEKGNLLGVGEDVFASLAEQGPQFWIAYEEYKETRVKSPQAQASVERQEDTQVPGQVAQAPGHGVETGRVASDGRPDVGISPQQ